MSTIIKFSLFVIFFIVLGPILYSQTAVINSINTSDYPWLSASYSVKDSLNQYVKISNPSDIIIKENGIIKTQKINGSPVCFPDSIKAYSICFVLDASMTMYDQGIDGSTISYPKKIDIALNAMKTMLNKIDFKRAEASVIVFGAQAVVVKGWSYIKDSLLRSCNKSNIPASQYTDYNAAFLGQMESQYYLDSSNSALYLIKSAKYNRIIIFLTDGAFNATQISIGKDPVTGKPKFLVNDVIKLAKEREVRILCAHIGNSLDSSSEINLDSLSGVEGNVSDNLALKMTNADTLNSIFQRYLELSNQIGSPAPCQVIWKSQCEPNGTRTLEINFPNQGNLSATRDFTIPDNDFTNLHIYPKTISIVKPVAGQVKDTIFNTILYTLNDDVDILGYSTNDSANFQITGWGDKGAPPFKMNRGDSVSLTLKYRSIDSLQNSKITILSSACSADDISIDYISGINDESQYYSNNSIANYPNPFTHNTILTYFLEKQSNVELNIFDLLGNNLITIISKEQTPGTFNVEWNGLNSKGENIQAGTYFYQLKANGFVITKPLIILK